MADTTSSSVVATVDEVTQFDTQKPSFSMQESSYIDDILLRVHNVCDMEIMETEIFKTLWDIVQSVINENEEEGQRYGLLIMGPAGAGKTTALIYLMQKLNLERKDEHCPCTLFISLESNRCDSFLEYLTWFCEVNKITCNIDANDPNKMLSTILKLRPTQLKDRKCFLFADMGMITKSSAQEVHQFVVTIKRAHTSNWYVILVPSNGVGWQYNTKDADACLARQFMTTFECTFYSIILKKLTSKEALFYIRMINAAKEGEEKLAWESNLSEATKGNPLLLRFYEGAARKGLSNGNRHVNNQLRLIMDNLIITMKDELYTDTLENCQMWLLYAEQEHPISLGEMDGYSDSYVAHEYLTYIEKETETHFFLLPSFPKLYSTFAKKCMEYYSSPVHDLIKRSAVVQGLVFEREFLHHNNLHELSVTTVTCGNDETHKFTFSIFSTPSSPCQCEGALQQLSFSCLYHLRPGHPAIDAVCLTSNTRNRADKSNYLLLIQVSLSKYAFHKNKAIDIRETVVKPEKDIAALSVAQFYLDLAKKGNHEIEEDHVVYIYASPEELAKPGETDFVTERYGPNRRSGVPVCPKYHYGFVDHDCLAGTLMRQLKASMKA